MDPNTIYTYSSPRRLSPLLSGNAYHLYCPETTITFTVRKRPHPLPLRRGWQKDLATAVRIAAQKLTPPLFLGGAKFIPTPRDSHGIPEL